MLIFVVLAVQLVVVSGWHVSVSVNTRDRHFHPALVYQFGGVNDTDAVECDTISIEQSLSSSFFYEPAQLPMALSLWPLKNYTLLWNKVDIEAPASSDTAKRSTLVLEIDGRDIVGKVFQLPFHLRYQPAQRIRIPKSSQDTTLTYLWDSVISLQRTHITKLIQVPKLICTQGKYTSLLSLKTEPKSGLDVAVPYAALTKEQYLLMQVLTTTILLLTSYAIAIELSK
jgi:hypothetical protein